MSETLTVEQSMAEANRILSDAGWTPIPNPVWGDGFVAGPLVGGVTPDGATQLVKNIAAVMPGDPRYGPDTPDEHHEAAAWLVATHGGVKKAFPRETVLEATADDALPVLEPAPLSEADAAAEGVSEFDVDGPLEGGDARFDVSEPLDADFTAAPGLTFEAEMAEAEAQAEPAPQDRYYGLDDFGHRKTVAIGLVMRHARALMPYWSTNEDAALVELRNFAMGVAEQRWPDNQDRQDELAALEDARRRISEIERVRDLKIGFIEAATRDEFDAFEIEAGWP